MYILHNLIVHLFKKLNLLSYIAFAQEILTNEFKYINMFIKLYKYVTFKLYFRNSYDKK